MFGRVGPFRSFMKKECVRSAHIEQFQNPRTALFGEKLQQEKKKERKPKGTDALQNKLQTFHSPSPLNHLFMLYDSNLCLLVRPILDAKLIQFPICLS